jgi:hypothetical protein
MPRRSSGRKGKKWGKPNKPLPKTYLGMGQSSRLAGSGKPFGKEPVERPLGTGKRIFPHELGMQPAQNGFAGKVEFVFAKDAKSAPACKKTVALYLELRSGFLKKRSVTIDGKPAAITERTLRPFNAALANASFSNGLARVQISHKIAAALGLAK